ncbi:MAG: translocation/assembly module TamB domain-containing protein [Myxococcaceae bacterium]
MLFVLAAASVLTLRSKLAADQACRLLRHQLPRLLKLEVEIAHCTIDPLSQRVELAGVALRPKGGEPVFSAESLEVTVGVLDPLFFSARLGRIRALRPVVRLDLSTPVAPSPTDPLTPCPLRLLERVGIDRIDVEQADVAVRLPGQRSLEIGGIDIRWRGRGDNAEVQVQASRGIVDLGPETEPLALAQLAVGARYAVRQQQVSLTRAEIGLDDFSVTVAGTIERLCEPRLQLDAQLFVPMRTLAKATGLKQVVKGHLWTRLGVSGDAKAPAVSAEVRGTAVGIGVYQPGDFRGRLSLAGTELTLQELLLPLGPGTARVSGQMQLSGSFPVRAKMDAERASFAAAVEKAGLEGPWVNFLGSGKAQVSGHVSPSLFLQGEADIAGEDFILTSQSWRLPHNPERTVLDFPQGRVTTRLVFHSDRVEFKNARVSRKSSVAEGEVTIWYADPDRLLHIEGKMPSLDLSDFEEIAGFRTLGRGTAEYKVWGPSGDVQVEASVALRDLLFWDYAMGVAEGRLKYRRNVLEFPNVAGQKGRTAYQGSLGLDFAAKGGLHAKLSVSAPKARVEDLIDLIVPLDPSVEVLQGRLTGQATASVEVDSPVKTLAGDIDVTLADVRFMDRRLGDGALALRFINGETLNLATLELDGPAGKLSMTGDYALDGGRLDYAFAMEPARLSELVGAERSEKHAIRGNLVLRGRIDGTSEVPRVSATLKGASVFIGQRDMGALSLWASLVGRDFTTGGQLFTGADVEARVKLKEPYPYDASLALALAELRPFLPARNVAQGLDGRLSGQLAARGFLGGTQSPEFSADVAQLELGRENLKLRNDGPIELRFDGRKLFVDKFQMAGPNSAVSALGVLGGPGLDLQIQGAMDLALLESFVPRLERASGKFELNAAMGGPVRRPSFVGRATWTNARFGVREQALSVRDFSGRADFSDARVLLEDVELWLNEGRVRARGEMALEGFSPRATQVRASLENVGFRPLPELPMKTSGELILTRRGTETPKLGGELTFSQVRYEQPIVLESFLERLLRDSGGRRAEESTEWLRLDIAARLTDARIDNNLARGRLSGNLRLVGTNQRPAILGTIEAASGGQAFFRGNQFTVTQGLLEFKDPEAQSVMFDLRAETQVREYRVLLHAFGRTADPKLLFTSEPPLPEGDIVSLLTLGITSRDRTNTAGTGAGLAAEALLAASGLDRQVQRFFPKNALLRDVSLRVATLYNSATGVVESTPQLESKLLTEQLKIRIAQPVSGRGTRAQAEYQFSDRLSAQAQWDNENLDYSFGNLGLDLKLRWEIE